jgi:hypothetical protein
MTATLREITYSEVRESIAVARSHGEKFFEQIVWQVENHVWTILGYESWDALREAEYADLGVVAPRADRPELVSRLRRQGLSQQQIGDTLGVSQRTVGSDLNRNSAIEQPLTSTNARGQERPTTYAPRPPATKPTDERIDPVTGEIVPAPTYIPAPAKVTDLDGKTDTRPEPVAAPRRRPLPEAFWETAYDLGKKAESLLRLTEDDRWSTNRDAVADKNLAQMRETANTLARVLAALETSQEV